MSEEAGPGPRLDPLPEVRLDEASMLEEARKNTGRSDFGDPRFLEGFRRLLHSLNHEARLNKVGRLIAHGDLLRHLENRLMVAEDWRRYPEMGNEKITRPLFVVGLPRTGSTSLHDLLAQDPANRIPLTWECHRPSPPPERETYETDPRIEECEAHLAQTSRTFIPEFQAVHPMGARLAQECVMLQAFDFTSILFAHQYRIPGYQAWVETTDLGPVYATHRRQLQYLQWRCPGERWVLKSVGHLWGLDRIFETYPDAQIVMTHRDPLKLIASHASLVSIACSMGSDEVDREEIGRMWSKSWENAMRKGIAFRTSGRVDESRFFDMHFSELVEDPVAMARRIYDHFGIQPGPGAEDRMRRFQAANPPGKHGKHTYRLDQFGLDPGAERERFRFYQDHYKVEPEV